MFTMYVLDMAAAETIPFPRTDTFSSSQAENFWQMRNDATYTDFTIRTKDKSFQVNTNMFSFLLLHLVSVRTFGVRYDHTFFYTCKSPDQTRSQIKLAVRLVIAYEHFNLPPYIHAFESIH